MKNKNDLILIVGLLIIGAVFAVSFFATRKTGNIVTVAVDGEIVATYSLDEDLTDVIELSDGESNTITITDGKVAVTDATCPDKLCVHMGTISKKGQTIVCLPHKLVVSIENHDDSSLAEFDGVSQ